MKKILTAVFFLFFLIDGYTQNVTLQEATLVAENFMKRIDYEKNFVLSKKSIKENKTILYKNNPSYYVVQYSEGGYVVISAYEGYEPILSYSQNGFFENENTSPTFNWWMNQYSIVIDSLRNINSKMQGISLKWDKYKKSITISELQKEVSANNASNSVLPLLTLQWGQAYPYNMQCPTGNGCGGDYNGRCAVGCLAIACGQVMRYWGYPVNVSGYPYPQFNYDWCNMPNKLYSSSSDVQKQTVSSFLRDIGNAVNMDYCRNSQCESGAYTKDLVDVLMARRYVASYTENFSESKLIEELKAGHPIIFEGWSSEGGHAFVIDGYDAETNKFNFNWGWDGSSNGYYLLTNHLFSSKQRAIYLCPDYLYDCNAILDIATGITKFPPTYPFIEQLLYNPPTWYGTLKTVDASYDKIFRTIKSGKTATYKATKEIILQDGFEVESGATFNAENTPCLYPCSIPNK